MIFSDRSIKEALEEGRIDIDPYKESHVQPSSVDLRVASTFRVFANHLYPYIDPRRHQEKLTSLHEVEPDNHFILHPGEFALGATLERVRLLRDLRKGEYDVLIGVNLLREGLDLPEVSLVAILDADKEGFLRSFGSLIQTIGRAARNVNGRAVIYADRMTDSMERAIDETDRRRAVQVQYNEANHITPQTISKPVDMSLARIVEADYLSIPDDETDTELPSSLEELQNLVDGLEKRMRDAAQKFEFEQAAKLRDRIKALKTRELTGVAQEPR